jgi:hypothetical protein
MTQPALEQKQLTRCSRKGNPRPCIAPGRCLAWRCGHESIQARILEFRAGRSSRHLHIVGAAQGRVGMKVQTVDGMPRHDIDPAIGHLQFARRKVPFNGGGKCGDVALELASQRFKGGRNALKTMHGGIRGVATRVVLEGPAASRRIVQTELPAFLQKLPIEFPRIAALQCRRIDQRGK